MGEGIENGRITHTSLGYEDHGILTANITVQGSGWGQGFGGWTLRPTDGNMMAVFVEGVLKAVGVENWEDLIGKNVRVDHHHAAVKGMGHIVEDKWFYPEKVFTKES